LHVLKDNANLFSDFNEIFAGSSEEKNKLK
jgi:hypothetical protein